MSGPRRGWGLDARKATQRKRRDLPGECEPGRRQSPHSTDAVQAARGPGSKNRAEGRGAGRWRREDRTEAQTAPGMPERATQGAEARCMIAGAEASVWTERMVSALVNGVKGGRWYSLMDKVYAPATLARVDKGPGQRGAAGVDGQASSGSRRRQSSIWLSCRRHCRKAGTDRRPSSGWRSRRAMAGRGRWASRRSRIASSSRRCGS